MTTAVEERELRLALVMTGGVSLAVWMGGVAAEVYRLVRGDGVYGGLLELTGTKATVDVVSGASAGGLNGALLGTALSYQLPVAKFDELRNLWFSAGSFTELLRNPKDKNPPSLLLGDGYFSGQVRDVLSRWVAAGTPQDPDDNPLTVVLTAALLSPDLQRRSDVFGVSIVEPVHRARFTFGPEHLADPATLPARLALAARTSASFPGAFEPSFVPIGPEDASADRPDMAGIASFTRSRWAVDGGVLMNKPVGPALDLIEARPAAGEIRRVLAYVNPDPGARAEIMDLSTDMPNLSNVVMSALLTLPRAESIADDLTDIAEYNRRFAGRQQARDRLVWGAWTSPVGAQAAAPDVVRDDLATTAECVYPLWVRRRTGQAVRVRIEAHLARTGADMSTRRGDAAHGFTYTELLLALEEARLATGWLPDRPPQLADVARGGEWRWGFTPIEYLASLVLDLVQRAFALLPAPAAEGADDAVPERAVLGRLRLAAHAELAWLHALRTADDDYYAWWLDHLDRLGARMCAMDLAHALYRRWPDPPLDLLDPTAAPPGSPPKARAGAGVPDPGRARRLRVWRQVQRLLQGEDEPGSEPGAPLGPTGEAAPAATAVPGPVHDVLEPHLGFDADDLQHRMRRAELRIARRLAALAIELGGVLERVVDGHTVRYARPEVSPAAEGDCAPIPQVWEPDVLRQTSRVLGLGEPGSVEGDAVALVLQRASHLFLVHATAEDDVVSRGSRITFAQIAATAPNQLVPERTDPATKVAGLQLGHFGAFLKESWRANDWMWGTLDGASRLVPLLLDPVRFRQRFASSADALDAVRALATGRASSIVREVVAGETIGGLGLSEDEQAWLESEWTTTHGPRVRAELAYLDPRSAIALPAALPATAAAITRIVQLMIAARELPEVAGAITDSTAHGGDESPAASLFVERLKAAPRVEGRLSIREVPALLALCKVGTETVAAELGSDAGAALATKAAAVAATAASGSRSGLGPLRHGAGAVRVALLAAYYTALTAARRSRIGFALVTLLLAVGAGAVAARLVGGDVPDSVLVVAIVALAFWVLLTAFTAGALGYAVGGMVILGAVALSFIPREDVCATFASSCDPAVAQPGWKGTIRWLVPVVLIVLALVFAVVAARTASRRALAATRTGRAGDSLKRKLWTWTPAILFGVAAALYVWVLHDLLFTGDATSGVREWAIGNLEGWAAANVLVVLVGLPLVFILLGYVRQAYRDRRVDRARRAALKKAHPEP